MSSAGRMVAVLLLAASAAAGGCGDSSGGNGTGTSVVGTLTLPGTASGAPYFVRVMSTIGTDFVAEATGTTTGASTIDYSLADVPAGTYFVLGFVDADASGGTASTSGDYRGWYGHTGDGNPPASPNAIVPSSGMTRFDFTLVEAP